MRIEKLTLRGFLRFRDTVAIDFTTLPAGLIALVAPNGGGKTTLLEAAPAALYRTWLSRGDLLDYATDRDSFLEVQIATDGAGTYRARVNVDGVQRKSDAVLQHLGADGVPVFLNDGKVSTFDAAIARHFPPKAQLLASAFAAQNKTGSFITLDRKGRKELFLQLLGLERYQTMSETARQAAALVDTARTRLVALRDVLALDCRDEVRDNLDASSARLATDRTAAFGKQVQLKDTIADLENRIAVLADTQAAYAAATLRVRSVETERASRQQEQRQIATDAERTRNQAQVDVARLEETAATEIAAIDQMVANNEKLRANAAQVRQAVLDVETFETAVSEFRVTEQKEAAEVTRLHTLERDVRSRIGAVEKQKIRLEILRKDTETLDTVPCGGQGEYAACAFLTRATAARAEVPGLEQAIAGLSALSQEGKDTLCLLEGAQGRLLDARARIATIDGTLTTARATAALAAPLAAADARIDELHAKRAETTLRTAQNVTAVQGRTSERIAELEQRAQAVVEQLATLEQDLQRATEDLASTSTGNAQALTLAAQLAGERAAWDQTVRAIATIDASQGDLERRRAEFDAKRAQWTQTTARLAALETEINEWATLAKAFSRDGLPVLEIDAAGPTISAYTNDLLASCYGPRFTVDVVTQEAKAGGKGMKETFTIAVIDNAAAGAARDIADLSGGEQVIVAEALANAIAIYVNTRSTQPVRTCWRDETTGALDPENAARYLAMLRKVQELGGFHHVLFITHNPDAAVQADAQIRLVDGTVQIATPPYGDPVWFQQGQGTEAA